MLAMASGSIKLVPSLQAPLVPDYQGKVDSSVIRQQRRKIVASFTHSALPEQELVCLISQDRNFSTLMNGRYLLP
jgi:hypothetical protein